MLYLVLTIAIVSNWMSPGCTNAAPIVFPSGDNLEESSETPSNVFDDPEETGSSLFKVTDVLSKRLSLSISVQQWRSKSTNYFRAHPTFIRCLQSGWNDMQEKGLTPQLMSGYLAEQEVPNDGKTKPQFIYSRAGTAARVTFPEVSRTTTNLLAVGRAFLRHCSVILTGMGRDLGLVLKADSLFVYMTGNRSESRQTFTVDGNSDLPNDAAFSVWAQRALDEIFDLPISVNCSTVEGLAQGATYPMEATSAADVVGRLDQVVTRWSGPDFARLMQFPANSVVFDDSASSGTSWCGREGNTCVRCPTGIVGNSGGTRCAVRTMSPRAFLLLNSLSAMAKSFGLGKIKVLKAWTELTSASRSTDNGEGQLHYEGRQLIVQLVDANSAATLSSLAKLAICAGFDYVHHDNSGQLVLAVVKQATIDTEPVKFYNAQVYPVTLPADLADDYTPPEYFFPKSDLKSYPLFDGEISEKLEVAPGVQMSAFRSRDRNFRYMRLQPSLADCLSRLTEFEGGIQDQPGKVKILRGFLSHAEERSLFDPILDIRSNTFSMGTAMLLNYENASAGMNIWRLARNVAIVCAPVFFTEGKYIGIGIYRDGVFVDMRGSFKTWYECPDCSELDPPDTDKEKFLNDLEERVLQSIRGRVITPTDPQLACQLDDPPRPQNPWFVYRRPAADQSAGPSDPNSCRSTSNTEFCRRSAAERARVVTQLWGYIRRKHLLAGEVKVKSALDGCLGVCGTCAEGPLWENKREACDNLVHWIPFGTLNDKPNVETALYPRGNEDARKEACFNSGQHCIDAAPLHSILSAAYDADFAWEVGKSRRDKLYDSGENPIPLPMLIARVFAYNAVGTVHLWVNTDTDLSSMEDAIKVIFVYNRNVTDVEIHLMNSESKSIILSILESYLSDWVTTGCPANTRIYLTPYHVEDGPKSVVAALNGAHHELDYRQYVLDEVKKAENGGLFGKML